MDNTITLRGKLWPISEPTFGVLKTVILLYANLIDANKTDAEKRVSLTNIMKLLVNDKKLFKHGIARLYQRKITTDEIEAFIAALPNLCGFGEVAKAHDTSSDPWGELYAFLAANHGYDWQQIDNTMTLSRWKLLNNYWTDYPPGNVLKAAELGYKPKRQETFLETAERMAGLLH